MILHVDPPSPRGDSPHPTRYAWIVLLACLAAATPASRAETLLYTLEIPDGQSISYTLELRPQHTGPMIVNASWPGHRVVSFRLEPPGRATPERRSGPSPQRLEVDVAEQETGPWQLSIRALAGQGGGSGRLTVNLPEPVTHEIEPAPLPVDAVSAGDAEPWLLPRETPPGVPVAWRELFEATERFRALVVDGDEAAPPDSCRWQDDLLRYLAERRERLVTSNHVPSPATRKLLEGIVDAVRGVEGLRTSTDPVLAGPPPLDPRLERIWLRHRRERMMRLESKLDDSMETARRGHARELGHDAWPLRLLSCVTACQRHFEERVRLGEGRASNRDLTRAQWERLLAAGEALAVLSELASEESGSGS